jgi:putative heme-binding domain-containing protein
LFESGNAETRERAIRLLRGAQSAERGGIIDQYKGALQLARNVERGEQIYQERCAECHVLRGEGHAVGPDLSAVRMRPDETLLADILDPSGVITAGYTAYLVSTADRELYTGTLAEETATSVTLRRAKGEIDLILRRDIAEMRALTVSLMPAGLEETMSVQDMADLLGFLRSASGPLTVPGVILFDDGPEFVAALTNGAGTAELCSEQPYSGTECLRITPLQRHSPNITGWNYRIVENPIADDDQQAESFRYLRLAWKADGDGVMIELAADGHWPPAQEPTRRYYSGANTTGWKAKKVAEAAPRQWTTTTVDLWKDFGEFTLTGIAPTAIGGVAYFDRIELLKALDDSSVLAMDINGR